MKALFFLILCFSLPANALQVCHRQQIQAGYVVTSAISSLHCPNAQPGVKNALVVHKVRHNIEACSISPIPQGFRIQRYLNRLHCPHWQPGGKNAFLLVKIH